MKPAVALSALELLGDRIRPVTSAGERMLPVPEVLAGVFPHGGLQRGTLAVVGGGAASSLALALVAPTTTTTGWVAVVGLEELGMVAAAELGVDLGRVLLVDDPGAGAWPTVVDALLDAVEIVVVRPPSAVGAGVQRRLMARARDRGSVLVQLAAATATAHGPGGRGRLWAQAPDLVVDTGPMAWSGLEPGHGVLRSRRVTVSVTGRRGADRPRRVEVLLPGPDGRLVAVSPTGPVATTPPGERATPLREVG